MADSGSHELYLIDSLVRDPEGIRYASRIFRSFPVLEFTLELSFQFKVFSLYKVYHDSDMRLLLKRNELSPFTLGITSNPMTSIRLWGLIQQRKNTYHIHVLCLSLYELQPLHSLPKLPNRWMGKGTKCRLRAIEGLGQSHLVWLGKWFMGNSLWFG